MLSPTRMLVQEQVYDQFVAFVHQRNVVNRCAKGGTRDERGTFGPLAIISPFVSLVVTEANRLPCGLAAYASTRSAKTANAIAAAVESGMMAINTKGWPCRRSVR